MVPVCTSETTKGCSGRGTSIQCVSMVLSQRESAKHLAKLQSLDLYYLCCSQDTVDVASPFA